MTASQGTTARPEGASTLTLSRPEGITDVRWEAIQATAHKVVTGHAPWCTDHQGDADDPDSWCRQVFFTVAAEVEVANGTLDGRTKLALYPRAGVDIEELTVADALAVAAVLETAAQNVKHSNLTIGMSE